MKLPTLELTKMPDGGVIVGEFPDEIEIDRMVARFTLPGTHFCDDMLFVRAANASANYVVVEHCWDRPVLRLRKMWSSRK